MIDPGCGELVFDDDIRLEKTLINISLGNLPGTGGIVCNGYLPVLYVHLFMYLIVLCGSCILHAHIGRQHLPFYLNSLCGPLGEFLRFCCNRAEGVAHLTNMIAQHLPVLVGRTGDRDLSQVEII